MNRVHTAAATCGAVNSAHTAAASGTVNPAHTAVASGDVNRVHTVHLAHPAVSLVAVNPAHTAAPLRAAVTPAGPVDSARPVVPAPAHTTEAPTP
ncbi:hypothetical protein GCM10010360_11490 [Streptomyces nogalater]